MIPSLFVYGRRGVAQRTSQTVGVGVHRRAKIEVLSRRGKLSPTPSTPIHQLSLHRTPTCLDFSVASFRRLSVRRTFTHAERTGSLKRLLTKFGSPPHVALLHLRYVDDLKENMSMDEGQRNSWSSGLVKGVEHRSMWSIEGAALTGHSRSRHSLRCKFGCERHGSRSANIMVLMRGTYRPN